MIKDVPAILNHICSEIKNFTEIAIVHLNGDPNSILLTAILKKSLGKENVYCLNLPYQLEFENKLLYKDPKVVADELGVNFSKKYLYSLTEETNLNLIQLFSNIDILKNSSISLDNLKNSIVKSRMSLIYGLRQQLAFVTNRKTRVVGSISLSEDFLNNSITGEENFADIFPLAELFESELSQLSNYFLEENIIPFNLTDRTEYLNFYEDDDPNKLTKISYNQLEASIRKIASDNWSNSEWSHIDEFVWKKHFENKNKKQPIRTLSLREKFCDADGFRSIRNSNRSSR